MRAKKAEKKSSSKLKGRKLFGYWTDEKGRKHRIWALPPSEGTPRAFTEEWQEKVAQEAKENGFIYPDNLAWLLAKDDQFAGHLTRIWPRYPISQKFTLNASTPRTRLEPCFWLVDTWIHGDLKERTSWMGHPKDYKSSIPTLRSEKRGNPPLDCIHLSDLKGYMRQHLGITPPLPQILFPSSGVDRTASSATILSNRPDGFPELNFDHLTQYAREWAEDFPAISQVLLYRYSTPVGPYRGERIPTKFFVVFSIKEDACEGERAKLWKATGCSRRAPSGISLGKQADCVPTIIDSSSYTAFMKDPSFSSTVYRKTPKTDGNDREDPRPYFKLEWRFFAPVPETPDQPLPPGVCTDRPYWVLYDRYRDSSALELDEMVKKLEEDPVYGEPEPVVSWIYRLTGKPVEPLDTFTPDVSTPLKDLLRAVLGKELKDSTHIKREDFKRLFREARLPLPAFGFPDEPDNSSAYADFCNRERSVGFDVFLEETGIQKELELLEGIQPRTITENDRKRERREELQKRLTELQQVMSSPASFPPRAESH